MSPSLPDKMLFRGIPPTLLLQWAFHGRGGYTPPDALALLRGGRLRPDDCVTSGSKEALRDQATSEIRLRVSIKQHLRENKRNYM